MTVPRWICYTDAVSGVRGAVSCMGVGISFDTKETVRKAQAMAENSKAHSARLTEVLTELDAPDEVKASLQQLIGSNRDLDRLHRRAPAAEAVLTHPTFGGGVLLVRDIQEVSTLAQVRAYTVREEAARG